jgi:uncharacterized protein (DUF1800 family)
MKQNLRNFCYISICSVILILGLGCYFSQKAGSLNNQPQVISEVIPKTIHNIDRLSFGIIPQQVTTIQAQGLENYWQEQLNPASIAESPKLINQLAQFDTLKQNSLQLWQTFDRYDRSLKGQTAANLSLANKQKLEQQRNEYRSKITRQVKQAHLARAIHSYRQLEEVMANFWLNHFNVFIGKKTVAFSLADYENKLRENALGNFRDLLGVTAHHPAMLVYLDNDLNSNPNSPRQQGNARGINENYARELMELHTLGVNGGYTQQDVTALARIFTGWGVDLSGNGETENGFHFDAQRHDSTDKEFLGQTITGSGIKEGEKALDILATHAATAHFISYKLGQYFVADTPPDSLVDKLTQNFIDSQGNIKTVLNTLFHSPEFNDPKYYKVKFKTPFQYLVSLVRASGLENPDLTKMEWMLNQLAMPIFGCETPNGYQNVEKLWLNPDAMLRRVSFATNIARGAISEQKPVDIIVLQATLNHDLTAQTQQVVAESPKSLKAALILGSPEMMSK